jgi:hypothetical protein
MENHIGRNRHRRSRGGRGLCNLHAVLPGRSNSNTNSEPSGELWNIVPRGRIDRHASYSNRRVSLRVGL